MPRVADCVSMPLAQLAPGIGPLASAILSQRMSSCKLSSGSNNRWRMKHSRMDHHVTSWASQKVP